MMTPCINGWLNHITASNAGSIAKRKATTKVASAVKQLLCSKFTGNTATRWGILQEESTKEQYLECKRKVSPDISAIPTDLIVSIECPWLAASPDGLVYDPAEDPPNGLVEFKNPYATRNIPFREATIKTKGFCLQYNSIMDRLQLKKITIIFIKFRVLCFVRSGSGVTRARNY